MYRVRVCLWKILTVNTANSGWERVDTTERYWREIFFWPEMKRKRTKKICAFVCVIRVSRQGTEIKLAYVPKRVRLIYSNRTSIIRVLYECKKKIHSNRRRRRDATQMSSCTAGWFPVFLAPSLIIF